MMESYSEANSKKTFKTDGAVKSESGMFTENNDEKENAASHQSSENNCEKGNSDNNFDSMLQMIKMINLMKGIQQTSSASEEASPKPEAEAEADNKDFYAVQAVEPLSTPFDESLQTPALKALKAAIPYLEPQQQKNVGLFAKLLEVQQLINLHNTENPYAIQKTTYTNNRTAILNAMRPYVSKEKQPMIDILIKVMDIKEIYEKIK